MYTMFTLILCTPLGHYHSSLDALSLCMLIEETCAVLLGNGLIRLAHTFGSRHVKEKSFNEQSLIGIPKGY